LLTLCEVRERSAYLCSNVNQRGSNQRDWALWSVLKNQALIRKNEVETPVRSTDCYWRLLWPVRHSGPASTTRQSRRQFSHQGSRPLLQWCCRCLDRGGQRRWRRECLSAKTQLQTLHLRPARVSLR